jgi:hypothetical protein
LLNYDWATGRHPELPIDDHLLTGSDTFLNYDKVALSLAQRDCALFGLHV